MKKNLFLRLCLMMSVLFTLWQCHSEDFNLAENNPKRNNSDFFKHDSSGGLTGRAGVDYVSILEDYNDEHNFLATMPDQEGMPIWEKMIVLDNENNTPLLVPLTTDSETLSSIIYVALNAENQVNSTKNIDNSSLENYVYDTTVSVEKREQLFYSFMFVDNLTFGNKTFTNIPSDMFSENTYTEYHRLKIKDIKIEGALVTLIDGKLMFESQCHWEWHCKGGEGMDKCDFCINCFRNVCSNIPVFTDDGPGSIPTGGGGGGGGGNSGGSTTNGPLPPKDPCTLSVEKAFYRLKPNCDVIGGTDTPLMNPCEKTKQMLMGLEVSDKIEELYQQSKTNTEKGVMIQSNGSTGPLIQGNENSVQLGNITGYQSYYHNHPKDQPDKKGVKIHSVNDIYKLFEFIVSQPSGTPVSDTYAGMVTSQPCGSPADCPTDGYLYINYLFTFTGTLAEAQAIKNKNYDLKALSKKYTDFESSIRNKSEYASQYGNFMNFKGLEKVFFNALDKMEIPKNLINLQRIGKDGKVYTVTLDANGTPIETPCP